MFLLKPTVIEILAIATTQAEQSSYSFRTTLNYVPLPGNYQPWLQTEAEERGLVKVSDKCSEGASFPGFCYTPSGDNP
jgi:hypothetical protein